MEPSSPGYRNAGCTAVELTVQGGNGSLNRMPQSDIVLPQRKLLLHQVTESLRKSMEDGLWQNHLPGERELSRRLHVSRPTLRAALEILEREKWIQSTPGKPRKLLQQSPKRQRVEISTVTLITPQPLYSMSRNRLFLFNALYQDLLESGVRLQVQHHPGFGSSRPSWALKSLDKPTGKGVYLLTHSSEPLQRWFADAALPSLVLGSVFPGVRLPSIECDYPALGRHAAGLFIGKGHRHVVVIRNKQTLAGDLETTDAFCKEIERRVNGGRTSSVLQHDSDPAELLAKWNQIKNAHPEISAIFSLNPLDCLLIKSHLQNEGRGSEANISFLSRDPAPFCGWVRPTLAHYQIPLKHFATRLSTLIHELIQSGNLPKKHTAIMPDYVHGDSLFAVSEDQPTS